MEVTKGITNALKDSQMLQSVASGIATAATWLWNIALEANPLVLIITLIALVVGAIILVGIKFGWWKDIINDVWKFVQVAFTDIKRVISDVFNWILNNWPLLLGILFGPFGLAVALILTHWQDVVDFFKGVPGKIKDALGDVSSLLLHAGESVVNGLLAGITSTWHKVTDFLSKGASDVKKAFTDPLSILSPSRVMMEVGSNVMAGLGIGLATGYAQHVAPTLANTVGAILAPTSGAAAAGASAGAAVASSSSGPVVSIQHAHFGSEVDVDAFMRRAAWVAKTRTA